MNRFYLAGISSPAVLAMLSTAAAVAAAPCGGADCPVVVAQAVPAPDPAAGAAPVEPSSGVSPPPAPAPVAPPLSSPSPAPTAPQATLPPSAPPPSPNPATPASQPASNAGTPPSLGTMRNANGSVGKTTGGTDGQFYGGTLSSPGRPQGSLQPAYGSTQRNRGLSSLDNAQPTDGMSPYGGTQSTIGAPQFGAGALYGRPQPTTSAGLPTSTRSLTGTTLPGNTGNYSRAPLGSAPLTRDQVGAYGGTSGYTAQGVYTGVVGQTLGYGQPYAPNGRPTGGLLSTGVDATGPLRPYIPSNTGGGRTNSGYGIPNGSRSTTMDARGIQRMN